MIKNIEFRKTTDVIQSKLQEDIKIVKQSRNVFISADKSTNTDVMEKYDYSRYLRQNITKTYKNTDRRNFGKALQKHTRKQTEGKLSQSIMN